MEKEREGNIGDRIRAVKIRMRREKRKESLCIDKVEMRRVKEREERRKKENEEQLRL